MTTEDLSTKPCPCGETMVQIIGHDENAKNELVPVRRGWYCFSCRHWEDAILRERFVEDTLDIGPSELMCVLTNMLCDTAQGSGIKKEAFLVMMEMHYDVDREKNYEDEVEEGPTVH